MNCIVNNSAIYEMTKKNSYYGDYTYRKGETRTLFAERKMTEPGVLISTPVTFFEYKTNNKKDFFVIDKLVSDLQRRTRKFIFINPAYLIKISSNMEEFVKLSNITSINQPFFINYPLVNMEFEEPEILDYVDSNTDTPNVKTIFDISDSIKFLFDTVRRKKNDFSDIFENQEFENFIDSLTKEF